MCSSENSRAHSTYAFPVLNFRSDRDRVNDIIICRLKSLTIGKDDLKENYNMRLIRHRVWRDQYDRYI